jgi:probable rRNA maturation factor
MILFDPEQSEAAEGFPRFSLAAAGRRAALPSKQTLTRYLREAQSAVGDATGLAGEVSVLLTTDEGIRGLNRRFRKKNKATDVLSFPVDDLQFGNAGDLVISVETAARQAEEHGHSLAVELRVLMLHGLLHLAGMDHEADGGEMARAEFALRGRLRLPGGLIERSEIREQRLEIRERKSREQGPGIREEKGRSRFPLGMTDRKAKAKATAKAKAKTTTKAKAKTTAKAKARATTTKRGVGR